MPQVEQTAQASERSSGGRIKLLTLAVTILCALAAVVAATVRAADPVLEILPANSAFTFANKGTLTLVTLSNKQIECEKAPGSGQAESKRLGQVTLKLEGCKNPAFGVACTGLSDTTAGDITLITEFHIRHLLSTGNGVAMVIPVAHLHFSCSVILLLVLGVICSDDLLEKEGGEPVENKLVKEMFINFLQEADGDPRVKEIDTDSSLGMEVCVLLTKEGTGGTYESSALVGSGIIKAPAGKTLLIDLSGAHE